MWHCGKGYKYPYLIEGGIKGQNFFLALILQKNTEKVVIISALASRMGQIKKNKIKTHNNFLIIRGYLIEDTKNDAFVFLISSELFEEKMTFFIKSVSAFTYPLT